MKTAEQRKKMDKGLAVQKGTIEGVILVNGKPQIERADMPPTFSFDSLEHLERFCEAAKNRSQDQH